MVSSSNHASRETVLPGDLNGVHTLLVEDAWQVGEYVKSLLQSAGATVEGPVATIAEADRLASERTPDVALVDFHLRGGELAGDLINRLRERGVTVVIISGYGMLPSSTARVAAILKKPFTDTQLLSTLQALIRPKATL